MPATPTTVFATKAESDSSRPRVLFPRPGCVRKYGCIYPPGFIFPMALRHSASARLSATAPPVSSPQRSGQFLRYSAPASNKPHPAEKRTPVWLAIWRTWAGFANSQLQCATFHSTYSYKFTSSLLPTCNCCSDIANLSAHLHRLPTPPTYLRRMRLLPGQGRMYRIPNDSATWPGHSS